MIKLFKVEVEFIGEQSFFIAIKDSCLAETQEIIDDQCSVKDLDNIDINVVQSVEIKSIDDLPYGLDKCVPDFFCDCVQDLPGTLGEILKRNKEIEKEEKDHPDQLHLDLGI